MADYKVELEPVELQGWAVYSGAEGDDPTFRAFFVDAADAEAFTTLRHSEDPETPLVFDPHITPAVLTEHGIVSANDYQIDTPEQLEARIMSGDTNLAELVE